MSRSDLVNPARRLPDLRLPALAGGQPRPVRASGRRSPVLVLVHGAGCEPCREYVRRLGEAAAALDEWDACVNVVLAEEPTGAGAADLPFPVLLDGEARLARALAVAAPAVVVADQWGEVHAVLPAGDGHRFPAVDELTDWARFLAVQCPECQGEAY